MSLLKRCQRTDCSFPYSFSTKPSTSEFFHGLFSSQGQKKCINVLNKIPGFIQPMYGQNKQMLNAGSHQAWRWAGCLWTVGFVSVLSGGKDWCQVWGNNAHLLPPPRALDNTFTLKKKKVGGVIASMKAFTMPYRFCTYHYFTLKSQTDIQDTWGYFSAHEWSLHTHTH